MRFLILLISLFIFIGCKKYPEDKNIVHFQKAKKRLWRGNAWYVTRYTVDGVDSLGHLNSYYWWKAPVEAIGIKFHTSDIKNDGKNMSFGWLNVGKNAKTPYLWEIKRLDKNVLCVEQVGFSNIIYRLELKGSQ